MPLKDYYDLVEPLELPIRGKLYRIPTLSAAEMIRWKTYAAKLRADEDIPDDEKVSDAEFFRMILGDALDEMEADGVLRDVILHAARTALADAENGREVAERVWAQTSPKAPETPPQSPKDSTPSPSTAGASTTRSRARTSGTKPRQK